MSFDVPVTNIMYHSGAQADPFNVSTLCVYAMVASSNLLIAYILVFVAVQIDLGARVLQAFRRGQRQPEDKQLLHTLPYYLAITRSSCEVRCSH